MEAREQKGLEIAAKSKLQQTGDGRWFVPSQTGRHAFYEVKPDTAKPTVPVLILKAASFAANISLQSNT